VGITGGVYPLDLTAGCTGRDTGGVYASCAGACAAGLAAGFKDMLANISIFGFSC